MICDYIFMYDGRDNNINSQTNSSIEFTIYNCSAYLHLQFSLECYSSPRRKGGRRRFRGRFRRPPSSPVSSPAPEKEEGGGIDRRVYILPRYFIDLG